VSLLVYTRITHSRQCCNLYLDLVGLGWTELGRILQGT